MSKILLPTLAGLLLLAGCSQNYVIVKNSGEKISAHGRPKYVNGYYYYTDATGQKTRISGGNIREVAPANMVSDPTAGFKSVHTD